MGFFYKGFTMLKPFTSSFDAACVSKRTSAIKFFPYFIFFFNRIAFWFDS